LIDVEVKVFDKLYIALTAVYPALLVAGVYIRAPASFPFVSIVEIDNNIYQRSQDTDALEHHANVTYELNVYSNKGDDKKSECRTIAALADSVFEELGFTRTMLSAVPNLDDANIYRITGRYRAVAGEDGTIYRR
jgi:uncharacterized protein YxeA